MKIRFEAPTPQSPGFLRRLQKAFYFSEKMKTGQVDGEIITGLADFLLDYVTEPKDRKKAKELILDASQEDFMRMLQAVMGAAGGSSVPLASGEPSKNGGSQE